MSRGLDPFEVWFVDPGFSVSAWRLIPGS